MNRGTTENHQAIGYNFIFKKSRKLLLAKFGRQEERFLGVRASKKLGKHDQGDGRGLKSYGPLNPMS